jgi:hypothetical protein
LQILLLNSSGERLAYLAIHDEIFKLSPNGGAESEQGDAHTEDNATYKGEERVSNDVSKISEEKTRAQLLPSIG